MLKLGHLCNSDRLEADTAMAVQFDHVQKGYNPRVAGERLPASYINHYIANGGSVVPAYGGKATDTDQAAREALARAHGPDRKVSDDAYHTSCNVTSWYRLDACWL